MAFQKTLKNKGDADRFENFRFCWKRTKMTKNAFLPSNPFGKNHWKTHIFSTLQKIEENPKMKIQNEKIQNEKIQNEKIQNKIINISIRR